MNIGVDLFSFDLQGRNYGVGPSVYVWNLLPELLKFSSNYYFYIFVNKEIADLVPLTKNRTLIISPFTNKYRFLRIFHEQIFIPYKFRKYNIKLVHFMGNNISYVLRKKSVITVHDLMWNYYIKLGIKNIKYYYFYLTVPLSIKYSSKVITVSNFIKDEIINEFNLNKDKIITIHEAPCKEYKANKLNSTIFKDRYNFKFIYSVTTSMPNKNLLTLIKAFQLLKSKYNYSGKLVITGQLKGNYFITNKSYIKENDLEKDIIFTSFISEEEKSYCYHSCECFVYPSFYEGFGLPILEAMRSGVPVIASNTASIPEVGADACLYFNPSSVEELVDNILLLYDVKVRNMLIKNGFSNVKKFSWVKTAFETMKVYSNIYER